MQSILLALARFIINSFGVGVNIILKIKNLKLTESFKLFIKEKIGGLKKLLKHFNKDATDNRRDTLEASVEVEKETKHHKKGDLFKAKAKINVPGKSFMAKAHGNDLAKAVTAVKDELESEIKKYKTKTIELPRRKYRKLKRFFKL